MFFKRSCRYENDNEKNKNESIVYKNDRVLMEIVLKNGRFQNDRFQKQSFFKKLVVSLTIVSDKPLLTIVNDDPSFTIVIEERRRAETDLKGIGTYH